MTSPAERLRARISAHGPIPFADVMAEALYGEGGYYARATLPIGESGDFVTGSSLSPLFGRATARLLRRLDAALGTPADFLEAGYGTAAHLAAVAAAAPGRRLLAHDAVARPLPDGVTFLPDIAAAGAIDGLVFSYELFDALPVHRLVGRAGEDPGELFVDVAADARSFEWREGPLSDPRLAALLGSPGAVAVPLAPGQVADLAPAWEPVYRALARTLRRGLLVTCDYGFERPQLLDVRVRRHGTLACYRGQSVHRDVLRELGRDDLTAHVDFTRLREAGEAEGLRTVAFTRQAAWLVACGIFEDLAEAPLAQRLDAMRLLDLAGMGEEIRVLVQARDLDAAAVLEAGLLR